MAGFIRHKREVHGPQQFFCTINTCKRHIQGFGRRHNLKEHMKRSHPQQAMNGAASTPTVAENEDLGMFSDETSSPGNDWSGENAAKGRNAMSDMI